MTLFQTSEAIVNELKPTIRPRSDWGAGLPAKGPLQEEEDVKFLLVHHTASRNDYTEAEVAGEIQAFYRFHTGPEKGWPDVAYNFFIDRFGGIWEAREGSIDKAIRGDATGGSQGFAVLCSLIGDYRTASISEAQQTSLTKTLAWLAEKYRVDTAPGATTDFISRGSNKWAEGQPVTAATISGHRDMSQTSCPGDLAYQLITDQLPQAVSSERQRVLEALTPTTTTPSTTSPTPASPATTTDNRPQLQAAPVQPTTSPNQFPYGPAALISGAVAALTLGLLGLRTRRERSRKKQLATQAENPHVVNAESAEASEPDGPADP